MREPRVVVWGPAATVEALAEAAVSVDRVDTEPPWDGAVEAVVTTPDVERVQAVRAHHGPPVVAYGEVAGEDVRTLLSAGAADVVQAGGSASEAVLADRVERALSGRERDPQRGIPGETPSPRGNGGAVAPGGHGTGGPGDHGGRAPEGGETDGASGGGPTAREYASILAGLDDGVYALSPAGRCTYVNERLVALSGYAEEELLGADPGLLVDERSRARIERTIASQWKAESGSVSVAVETTIECRDGSVVPCELLVTALGDDEGDYRGTVGLVRDVSDRERRGELLTRLQETTRSLMQAPSRETVARIVTDAARRTLGFDMCVFRLYDAETRELVPVASTNATDEAMAERPTYTLDEGPVGEVFVSGEPAVYDDVSTYDDDYDRSPVRSTMYFPIGVHGTLSVGTTTAGAFDEVDEQIATLLATNAAAACNRAKREREVRDARERVATVLERINGLVEDTIEVLVEATTRTDVERRVCAQLAGADPYGFAWIARPDVREEELSATEWAGDAALAVDSVAIPVDCVGPTAVAHREGTSRVLDAAAMEEAADAEPWLEGALAAGIESAMAVPLSYREGSFGVVWVCSERPEAFDDRERVVLEALGRAVANAINAIERGRILEADTVIELSIDISGGETLLGRLSAAAGADLASAGTMTEEEGGLRLFLSAAGADADAVEQALAADDAVTEASLVAELDEESLFDVSADAPLIDALVEHGAVPKAVSGSDGVARLTVELPSDAAAREAFAIVEDRHPTAELAGYHEHERPVRTQQEFRAALSDRFTDRQETALRSAYLGGFFDSPRGVDGDELAEGMDIARPTYHQHLRAAQRKVFEELFAAETPSG